MECPVCARPIRHGDEIIYGVVAICDDLDSPMGIREIGFASRRVLAHFSCLCHPSSSSKPVEFVEMQDEMIERVDLLGLLE